jgi:hypothetical protein
MGSMEWHWERTEHVVRDARQGDQLDMIRDM